MKLKTIMLRESQAQDYVLFDSFSVKLQERQNHSDKADQWLPRDGVGEGKAGAQGHKGTFFG